jgi:hypothetical protein
LWDAAFSDFWWLERFGLDPDRVRALPLNTRDRVPLIAAEADRIAEAEMKKR